MLLKLKTLFLKTHPTHVSEAGQRAGPSLWRCKKAHNSPVTRALPSNFVCAEKKWPNFCTNSSPNSPRAQVRVPCVGGGQPGNGDPQLVRLILRAHGQCPEGVLCRVLERKLRAREYHLCRIFFSKFAQNQKKQNWLTLNITTSTRTSAYSCSSSIELNNGVSLRMVFKNWND